jgi:phage tail-like protein
MADRKDPYRGYNFVVEIGGVRMGYFTEVTGFEMSVDPTDYREGGMKGGSHKLPGVPKYTNVTLKWGLSDSMDLYDWFKDVVNGKIVRKDGSIVVLDLDGNDTKVRWNFYDAWPSKWNAPDFNAKGTDVAIETLELAVERVERG